ncbi:MAG: hypothetical protein PHH66_13075, partial [Flavobacterium sp.]|nr:hypothetical protein [Flavobacterium sp.]
VIENIAQTCAAGFSFLHQQAGKKAGELGFIGAVSKLEVVGHVFVNQGLQTEIKILNQFENIHLVEGISYSNNKEILKCQLKIVLG